MTESTKKFLLGGYFSALQDVEGRKRYQDKLSLLGGLDPYETTRIEWLDDVDLWPTITHMHVGMYLLHTPSPYTGDELLNYKSLDCYQNFLSGWVREVLVKVHGNKGIVVAKVNHSQRMSAKPLTPWIAAEENGRILVAHCDCMAGLGESCSHVASLLFAIESGVRIRESMTVTQKKAYWVMPTGVKVVQFAPVRGINFIGKKRSAAMMKSTIVHQHSMSPSPASSLTTRCSKSPTPVPSITPPDDNDFKSFLSSLASCPSKPAVLSLVKPYSSNELFKPEYLDLNYGELAQRASNCNITVTPEEVKAVEEQTRFQSNSTLWYRMRTGRITASRFKSACHTNPALPSLSLINSICYPETTKFKSVGTNWGCEHEKTAVSKYIKKSVEQHMNFHYSECGFFINTSYPFIGASPDGLVDCGCCECGICEVKCPFCHKDSMISDAVNDPKFCLQKDGEEIKLKHDHAYYYQIQCQLFCSNTSYCDFVLWTNEDLHIERIYPDESLWLISVDRVKLFFNTSILVELLGKFYSRTTKPTPQASAEAGCSSEPPNSDQGSVDGEEVHSNTVQLYCYCQGPEEGDMVGCDNPACIFQWFHLECLKLKSLPQCKSWYCPDCRKLPELKRRKKKKN